MAAKKKEDTATIILAQKLPSLVEVRWANRWAKGRKDEITQRCTNIIREGDRIVLSEESKQTVK